MMKIKQHWLTFVAVTTMFAGLLWAGGCLEAPPDPQGTDGDGDVDGDVDGDGDGDGDECPLQPTRGQDCEEMVYRDNLDDHPGCSIDEATTGQYEGQPLGFGYGKPYQAAVIPGYRCAAKAYPVVEDPSKPIVLLFHGNALDVSFWEATDPDAVSGCDPAACSGATAGEPMLAERLSEAGFRTLAVDLRYQLTPETGDDPDMGCERDDPQCNLAHSFDHGWAVPIAQHFIHSVMEAHPDRRFVLIGHSLGPTIIRDALRRLFVNECYPVFDRIDHVILLSGGNRGVSVACGASECGVNNTMRGRSACEIGNRDAYAPSCFQEALSGPNEEDQTPCSDGNTAFGAIDACGGNTVRYSTLVIEDYEGTPQDLCVGQATTFLEGADNRTIPVSEVDESCYFLCGVLKNHVASARSLGSMDIILHEFLNVN